MTNIPQTAALQGVVPLADWGLIRAQGAEARKFLHGQLTQDVEQLPADTARLAGYCTAKGRLLATFVFWSAGPEEVLLACSADLLPSVLKRLSMFVMRARCQLTDVSAEWPLSGVVEAPGTAGASVAAGSAWPVHGHPGGWTVRLPDARLSDGSAVPRTLAVGTAPVVPGSLDAATWQGLEVLSGVARVVAATSEQFVPQMVNLEVVGGVNFQKGCYPGQEVVARSQYRGTLKRRAQVLSGDAALAPGQEVFHSADPSQPAGLVALSGHVPGLGCVALAELKLAALADGTLHLGSPAGPCLRLGTLPYALPQDGS
jgi:folate-binding protein YgfZ